MGKNKKANPRKQPRTEEDVRRAWKEGCIDGMRLAEAIFLSVLKDKHDSEIDVLGVWREIAEKTKAMNEGYFTPADLRRSLKEDYGIELLAGPSKAIAHCRRKG